MNHQISVAPARKDVKAKDMERGQIAVAKDGYYAGRVLYRSSDRLIVLDNGDQYSNPNAVDYAVEILPPGSVLTIEVK